MRIYLGIELCWHVGLFTSCFYFRPLLRLGNTPWGRGFLARTKQFFGNRTSPRWAAVEKWSSSFMSSNWGRATTEWFFINKLTMPVAWPGKIALAHWLAGKKAEKDMEIEVQKRATQKLTQRKISTP